MNSNRRIFSIGCYWSMLLIALLLFNQLNAAIVDTVSIYSNAMGVSKKCVVIRPDRTKKRKSPHYPVVYLLHGWSGSFSDWIKKVPALQEYAEENHCIIVCPDGDYAGWYIDSPIDPKARFETYISTEVPAYIDQHYPTIKERKARAITGLSMGGHGALFISNRHADFFGAAGSMSGVVDLNSSRNKYGIIKKIGDTIGNKENWRTYSVINAIEIKPTDSLAIIIDCGLSDVFAPYNRKLHEKMLKLGIAHDYIERPGNHNWEYWANAVQYQLLFFRNYFKSNGVLPMNKQKK